MLKDQDKSLQSVVGDLLRIRGLTLATAESCTGGTIGALLTSIPGSSDYYRGGGHLIPIDLTQELECQMDGFGPRDPAIEVQRSDSAAQRFQVPQQVL